MVEKNLGERLKARRKALKLTQQKLGEVMIPII